MYVATLFYYRKNTRVYRDRSSRCHGITCLWPCLCVCVFYFLRSFFAFDRTFPIYVVFHSRGFYDVPRVLIADAGFGRHLGLYDTALALMSCRYRSEARQDELRSSKVWGYDHIWRRCSANKNTQIPVIKQQNATCSQYSFCVISRTIHKWACLLACWNVSGNIKRDRNYQRSKMIGTFYSVSSLSTLI